MLPMIRLAYGSTGAPAFAQLFQPALIVGMAIALLAAAHLRLPREGQRAFAEALLVAAAGFAIAYFIQRKGWTYHAIPMVGCAAIALAAVLARLPNPRGCCASPARCSSPCPSSSPGSRRATPLLPGADLEAAIAGVDRREPASASSPPSRPSPGR